MNTIEGDVLSLAVGGLANGNWTAISKIIAEELSGEDHTLVEFVSG